MQCVPMDLNKKNKRKVLIENLFDFVVYLKPKLQIVTKANFHK